MWHSCCYAPDILEMLQADLVMRLKKNLLLDMLVFFCANLLFFFRAEWGRAYPAIATTPQDSAFLYGRRTTLPVDVILGASDSYRVPPFPVFLFVLQNIVGYKNKIKRVLMSA